MNNSVIYVHGACGCIPKERFGSIIKAEIKGRGCCGSRDYQLIGKAVSDTQVISNIR